MGRKWRSASRSLVRALAAPPRTLLPAARAGLLALRGGRRADRDRGGRRAEPVPGDVARRLGTLLGPRDLLCSSGRAADLRARPVRARADPLAGGGVRMGSG